MENDSELAKISIITINHRPEFQKQVEINMREQTYDNLEFLYIDSENIPMSLGSLRNQAIKRAKGDYIAIFDSDDYSHPDRLKKQMDFMDSHNLDVCALNRVTLCHEENQDEIESHWRLFWEGTILAKKWVMLKHPYHNLNRQEDQNIKAIWNDTSIRSGSIDDATLYEYWYHGNNTSGQEHFKELFKKAHKL